MICFVPYQSYIRTSQEFWTSPQRFVRFLPWEAPGPGHMRNIAKHVPCMQRGDVCSWLSLLLKAEERVVWRRVLETRRRISRKHWRQLNDDSWIKEMFDVSVDMSSVRKTFIPNIFLHQCCQHSFHNFSAMRPKSTPHHQHTNPTPATPPHHHKNTTTRTPPQKHHTTTKTPPHKTPPHHTRHHHKNSTTKTPPHKHHHKNTTTPPQKHHHTTTPPPPHPFYRSFPP